MKSIQKISVVFPVLNEKNALEALVQKTIAVFNTIHNPYEIILIDNGSVDGSKTIADTLSQNFDTVFSYHEQTLGYGSAYKNGFSKATGDILIMLDADGTYEPRDIPLLLEKIERHNDLVVANRTVSSRKKKTMKWLHAYVGNPFFTFLISFIFRTPVTDVYSGFRAIRKSTYTSLNLKSDGMEFALEMIIEAAILHVKTDEIETQYHHRIGDSKLHPWKDGFRSLYFIFSYRRTKIILSMIISAVLLLILAL